MTAASDAGTLAEDAAILQTVELWSYPTRAHKTRAAKAQALAAAG